jgi:hypothetical protein
MKTLNRHAIVAALVLLWAANTNAGLHMKNGAPCPSAKGLTASCTPKDKVALQALNLAVPSCDTKATSTPAAPVAASTKIGTITF